MRFVICVESVQDSFLYAIEKGVSIEYAVFYYLNLSEWHMALSQLYKAYSDKESQNQYRRLEIAIFIMDIIKKNKDDIYIKEAKLTMIKILENLIYSFITIKSGSNYQYQERNKSDCYSVGVVAILENLPRYHPQRIPVLPTTFFYHHIFSAINRYMNKENESLSIYYTREIRKIRDYKIKYMSEYGRYPNDDTIALYTGVSLVRVKALEKYMDEKGNVSFNAKDGEEIESMLLTQENQSELYRSLYEQKEMQPDDIVLEKERKKTLYDALETLPTNQRELIYLKECKEWSWSKIFQLQKFSETQSIKREYRKGLRTLRGLLEKSKLFANYIQQTDFEINDFELNSLQEGLFKDVVTNQCLGEDDEF